MIAHATRRAFLTSAALASAHRMLAQEVSGPLRDGPASARQRFAVATYPFRARIIAPGNTDRNPSLPGLDLAAFARYIRTEFEVSGIEPLHSHFPSTDPAEIRKLRHAFDAVGVRTVNIPVDEDIDLTSADPHRRDSSYRTIERWIEIAVILGSPSIRIGAVPHGAGAADIAGPAAALQPLIRYGAARNVVLLLENDDPVFGTAARITALLAEVNSPFLRGLPDFANALMGGEEAFNAEAVRNMFRFAANICHVKDAESIHGIRRAISLPNLLRIARDANFRGVYSLESDSDADPVADTHHLLTACLALL